MCNLYITIYNMHEMPHIAIIHIFDWQHWRTGATDTTLYNIIQYFTIL